MSNWAKVEEVKRYVFSGYSYSEYLDILNIFVGRQTVYKRNMQKK